MTPTPHDPRPGEPQAATETVGIDFLAEILAEQELPYEVDIDLTVADLTIVDEDPAGAERSVGHNSAPPGPDRTNRWDLSDDTDIGAVVTPEHVLAARSGYRRIADGRPLPGSDGILYQSVPGFAAEYVWEYIIELPRPNAATQFGAAVGWAELAGEAQYRLEYFLNLPDDDFLACFRFNGDITREYLTQVARCERLRAAGRTMHHRSEPSPRQRRIHKARSLNDR